MKKTVAESNKSIVWFRQDLRLSDNPALNEAAHYGQVMPVYIDDTTCPKKYQLGSASQWWLHYSLEYLSHSLNSKLSFFQGDPAAILISIIETYNIQAVFWNRCYEPWQIKRDIKIKQILRRRIAQVQTFNASLLWEPWENLKSDDTPYKVFTPFYQRGCLSAQPPREPLKKAKQLALIESKNSLNLTDLKLLPKLSWGTLSRKYWQPGEAAAKKTLAQFVNKKIEHYAEDRNFPDKGCVSRLSPHLHFGEISPNQAWYSAKNKAMGAGLKTFLTELGWREFSYSLLYHFPELPNKNWQTKFNNFGWKKNKKLLTAWKKGLTGYPIVDAGMRELWQTGYMHNRVRMIVASFLVKNCLIDWREGAAWFWDCLVDADLANNSASWQWVAGCGADAAPYFRIFNPVSQGKRFDEQGLYTRKYVPELKHLPNKYLFSPWEAPQEILEEAKVVLGQTYPKPVVDLRSSREHALLSYQAIKNMPK